MTVLYFMAGLVVLATGYSLWQVRSARAATRARETRISTFVPSTKRLATRRAG